jgi:arsenite methyltransferase
MDIRLSDTTATPDYGIDAPGVIRNLALSGIACLATGLLSPPVWHLGAVDLDVPGTLIPPGIGLLLAAALMLLYALRGKFTHRDRLLELHDWRGTEQVLDVGTGRGLLLIGAARRLTTGRAIGLDVWNPDDLSGNDRARTERNLQLEGVSDRCSLVTESAAQMRFADASFDVVLSNLCLHNIYDKATRAKACEEIARVLKPGGVAIISDYKLTAEYASLFERSGLVVERQRRNWLTTFPPLATVIARRPDVTV